MQRSGVESYQKTLVGKMTDLPIGTINRAPIVVAVKSVLDTIFSVAVSALLLSRIATATDAVSCALWMAAVAMVVPIVAS